MASHSAANRGQAALDHKLLCSTSYSVVDAVDAAAPFVRIFGNVASVAELACELPAGLASCVGFECRLGKSAAAIDLSIEISSSPTGRSALIRFVSRIDLDAPRQHRLASRQLRDFCTDWNDTASPLHDAGPTWLEFDVQADERGAPPVPGLLSVELPAPDEAWSASTGLPATGTARRVVERTLRIVKGSSVPPILSMLLDADRSDFAAMRPCVLGLPIARTSGDARVCLRVANAEDIRPGLEQLGWRPSARAQRQFDGLLSKIGPVCGRIFVDVDLGPNLSPSLGLEIGFPRRVGPLVHPGWPDLLSCIVALGLCTTEKRDALLRFPGESMISTGARGARVRRQINHVKVMVVEGQAIGAKAYLAATFPSVPAPARTAPS
jgi:hypothetical protein